MLDYTQLEALLAVDEAGTFEGAARELNLSSFAIVQRIKTLEGKLGVRLIDRSPTRTTEVGKILCEHTREVRSLEYELTEQHKIDSLDSDLGGGPVLKIAIVDESLSNWFLAISDFKTKANDQLRLDVQLTDVGQAIELMRSGKIVAALTNDTQTVYGFKTYMIGSFIYRAVASPTYIEKYFNDGVTPSSMIIAPTIRVSSEDKRTHDWVYQIFGSEIDLPMQQHPSSHGTLHACLEGRVWAMQSDVEIADKLESGELIELIPNRPLTHTLYWHVAGTMVDTVRPITRKLKELSEIYGD